MTADTLTVLFLFATVALRVALVALVIWVLVPSRTRCRACGTGTEPLVTGRLLSFLRFEQRWCLGCGWWGVSKRLRQPSLHPPRPQPNVPLPR